MQTLIDLFLALVAIDSPSYQEDLIALFVEQQLLSLGLATVYDEAGNLYATLPGSGEPLLFNAHLDTVALARGAKPIIADGMITSDGTTALGADDKAAGAVGTAVIQAAFHDMIEATFTGRAAHAGFEPEKGVSAIMMASRAIEGMKLLRIDEETTANVGSFIAEGAKNIVSEEARLVFEARSLDEQKLVAQSGEMKRMLKEAATFFGGEVAITHTRLYDDYRHSEESEALRHFADVCTKLDIPFATKTTLGGSDANVLNRVGIPTLAITSGYSGAHSTSERIAIADLEALGRVTVELMRA